MLDPDIVKRSYDDIENIIRGYNLPYKTHEETGPDGKFKSYSVETR